MSTEITTQSPPYFPFDPNADSRGMKCSLSGVLGRAAERCKRSRDAKHLEWGLLELNKHIEILREAKDDQDAARLLARFLTIWPKN